MTCPICQKHKAKRMCPARAESICSVCCGTEREVTIDCPSDCVYLAASRVYDAEHRKVDWSKVPFAENKIPLSFIEAHEPLLGALDHALLEFAANHRESCGGFWMRRGSGQNIEIRATWFSRTQKVVR